EFLAADVLGTTLSVVAAHHLADEAGLGFQRLPHVGVEAAFGDVAIDGDLLVLVALAENAAIALLDLGWLPGGVEMVQGSQTFLDVGARAHFLRAADQYAH